MIGLLVVIIIGMAIVGIVMRSNNASKAADLARRAGEDPGPAAWRLWFSDTPRVELENLEMKVEMRERVNALDRERREANARMKRESAEAAARIAAAEAAAASAASAAAFAADDRPAAERLQELQDLYTKGLVNEDEFSDKRRQILGDV